MASDGREDIRARHCSPVDCRNEAFTQVCALAAPFSASMRVIDSMTMSAVLPHRELFGIFVRFQVFDKPPDDPIAFIVHFIQLV